MRIKKILSCLIVLTLMISNLAFASNITVHDNANGGGVKKGAGAKNSTWTTDQEGYRITIINSRGEIVAQKVDILFSKKHLDWEHTEAIWTSKVEDYTKGGKHNKVVYINNIFKKGSGYDGDIENKPPKPIKWKNGRMMGTGKELKGWLLRGIKIEQITADDNSYNKYNNIPNNKDTNNIKNVIENKIDYTKNREEFTDGIEKNTKDNKLANNQVIVGTSYLMENVYKEYIAGKITKANAKEKINNLKLQAYDMANRKVDIDKGRGEIKNSVNKMVAEYIELIDPKKTNDTSQNSVKSKNKNNSKKTKDELVYSPNLGLLNIGKENKDEKDDKKLQTKKNNDNAQKLKDLERLKRSGGNIGNSGLNSINLRNKYREYINNDGTLKINEIDKEIKNLSSSNIQPQLFNIDKAYANEEKKGEIVNILNCIDGNKYLFEFYTNKGLMLNGKPLTAEDNKFIISGLNEEQIKEYKEKHERLVIMHENNLSAIVEPITWLKPKDRNGVAYPKYVYGTITNHNQWAILEKGFQQDLYGYPSYGGVITGVGASSLVLDKDFRLENDTTFKGKVRRGNGLTATKDISTINTSTNPNRPYRNRAIVADQSIGLAMQIYSIGTTAVSTYDEELGLKIGKSPEPPKVRVGEYKDEINK